VLRLPACCIALTLGEI